MGPNQEIRATAGARGLPGKSPAIKASVFHITWPILSGQPLSLAKGLEMKLLNSQCPCKQRRHWETHGWEEASRQQGLR